MNQGTDAPSAVTLSKGEYCIMLLNPGLYYNAFYQAIEAFCPESIDIETFNQQLKAKQNS